jgi:hypothetical protein
MQMLRSAGAALAAILVLPLAPAAAQPPPSGIDGPLPPERPTVMARDTDGRATIRATRLTAPLRLDGLLDDAIYREVPPMSDFIQMEPSAGAPATEKTEVWVFFDEHRVYVTTRSFESQPDRMIVNELRHDNSNITQNDYIAFGFDTFYDRRNGYGFTINPLGGRIDGQVTNERQWNGDLNPLFDVEVSRFEGGWIVEASVPFKSLRYQPGRSQVWGFQVLRYNKWKNEGSFLTRVPNARGGPGAGWMTVSRWATLVDIEAPAGTRVLDLKPYAIGTVTTDATARPRVSNDLGADAGMDAKVGVTQNLSADLTFNTDFAQVEADEQQVNLTRFSLFFPEKREFFLENQGTFAFGTPTTQGSGDMPLLFYSRRIGLNAGRAVPVDGGGRVTGRMGPFTIGALNIQTGDDPATSVPSTNYSVVRVKRDLFRRSSVGAIYTGRSKSSTGAARNDVFGVDGMFAFFESLAINSYWATSRTGGLSGGDASYRVQLDYTGDRYGLQMEHLLVGDNFKPEVGFLRRDDMRRNFAQVRFSPRSTAIKAVRKFSWVASADYVENTAGRLETRDFDGEFAIEFQNSDRFHVGAANVYEFLPEAFAIAPGIVLPVAGYRFSNVRTGFNFGQQRPVAGNVSFERGAFYNGRRTAISASRGRIELTSRLSMEPTVSVNWVELGQGRFTTTLIGSRVTQTATPMMFVSALVQYNSSTHSVAANVRLRWEYAAGSELFVVFNEQRDRSAGRTFTGLTNRAVIVKLTRLWRL